MATFEVIFDNDPKVTTESIYGITKELAKSGRLKTENIEALAELMEELANRMKEGEFSEEQEG
jgi:hypothetical protein